MLFIDAVRKRRNAPQHAVLAGRQDASVDLARQQLRSYGVILAIFVFLLAVAVGASWVGVKVVDSARAYVAGESRYSKAEKIAVLALDRYAYSGAQRDYEDFLAAVEIPKGDHMARLALEAPVLDMGLVRRGFLRGQNHPDDIEGMAELFRWFSWWHPFAAAVSDWRNGDALVGQLIAEGARLHALGPPLGDPAARQRLLSRIERVDAALTVLEDRFSAHLGAAARATSLLVVAALSLLTIALWAMGTAYAARLVRRQLALDRRLAASERRFRDFAEVASDWYWETDADDRITYVSDRFSASLGEWARDAIGQSESTLIGNYVVTPELRDAYRSALIRRREFRGIQISHDGPGGTRRYWTISGKPYRDVEGKFLGYRGVGADITALAQHAQDLQEAKDHAVASNHAKSEFLANMSHELRTPLNAILGFSDMIKGQMLGREAIDRYSAYAADIHKSGKHLLTIIDDILDLSKVEAGQTALSERTIAFSGIADTIHTMLSARFRDAGITFRQVMPEEPVAVIVDENKFAQIFLNLLSNALKFTDSGGEVVLGAQRRADGGLAIMVRDTGIGIAVDDIPVVLSPFGQVESAFSRKHHGTGLGLPLAKSLAELHGGRLYLESTPGVGTTVTVTLPPERVVSAPRRASRVAVQV